MMWPFTRRKTSTKQPPIVATIISIPGKHVRVTLTEHKGFKDKDLQKLIDALLVLSYVVNSEEFEIGVKMDPVEFMNYRNYTSTLHASQMVYHMFMNANELGTTGDDKELDFSLRYYNSWWSRVIGYTYPKQLHIWLNWKYHLHFKPWQTAGNLCHEQAHKLGYGHRSATEYTSVPYAIGYLVEGLGERFYEAAMEQAGTIEVTQIRSN